MKAKQDHYGVFDIDILEVSLKITQYLLTDLRTYLEEDKLALQN